MVPKSWSNHTLKDSAQSGGGGSFPPIASKTSFSFFFLFGFQLFDSHFVDFISWHINSWWLESCSWRGQYLEWIVITR